jgi:RND family efflux transporter MFP subunit
VAPETNNSDLSALRIKRPAEQQSSKRRSRTGLALSIGVGILVLLVASYFLLSTGLESAVEVELVTATLTSPAQANAVLTASGYVVAQRKAAVASKGTGRLVYLGVEEGDRVKKGQIIARIEDEDVKANLDQAQENLRTYEAEFNDAQQSLERQRNLLAQNLASQADFDAAEFRYKRVVASIGSAKAAVDAAEVAVENTRIRAPFDGTVILKHADVGEVVAPFGAASNARGAVVTIADMASLEVETDVSESNIERISPKQPCEIVLDAYPDHRYQGYVSKIVPTADRAKATVMTKVKFLSYDSRVLPEMSAKVTFLSKALDASTAVAKSAIALPATAVANRDGKPVVFVVRDGRATEIPVVVGERIGQEVVIKAGISGGEKVIAVVNDQIKDGVKVKVK